MCVQDLEQVPQGMENLGTGFAPGDVDDDNDDDEMRKTWSLPHSPLELCPAQNENWEKNASLDPLSPASSSPLESIGEDTAVTDTEQVSSNNFLPSLRTGECSDIGGRSAMEDTHICIEDLAENFGRKEICEEAISLYGVFDGHDGESAAQFVREQLPRVIVEDADFPLELEKVVTRSFIKTDAEFKYSCSRGASLSSGTTALTAMIFGGSLLVANAGDCRAVLSRRGVVVEMSKDHKPSCMNEKKRIESVGGYISGGGYLNGRLGVTRALGDWQIEGMKEGKKGGPLSAEPELKLLTLTKEDEFLIIGSDGLWDVFSSQNAVDVVRRRLQEHNNVKQCCMEIIEEAKKRGAMDKLIMDNLTVVIVCFHLDRPPSISVPRPRVRRSISAEVLHKVKFLLER